MLKPLFSKIKNIFNKPASFETAQTTVPQKENALNTWYNKYKEKFVEKIFTKVVLSPEDGLCAQIAAESYVNVQGRKKTLDDYTLDEKNSTNGYCVYSNLEKKICIIGYRGTVITDIKDIASDAQIVLDIQGIDPRVKNALNIYDTIKREYPGYKLRVCGHSLGGTISYIVGKHRIPDRCVVFNPGVSLNTFFIQMLQDSLQHAEWAEHTYTYKILGDIISAIGYIGHVKTFVVKGSDPLALHAMENYLTKQVPAPQQPA